MRTRGAVRQAGARNSGLLLIRPVDRESAQAHAHGPPAASGTATFGDTRDMTACNDYYEAYKKTNQNTLGRAGADGRRPGRAGADGRRPGRAGADGPAKTRFHISVFNVRRNKSWRVAVESSPTTD